MQSFYSTAHNLFHLILFIIGGRDKRKLLSLDLYKNDSNKSLSPEIKLHKKTTKWMNIYKNIDQKQ